MSEKEIVNASSDITMSFVFLISIEQQQYKNQKRSDE